MKNIFLLLLLIVSPFVALPQAQNTPAKAKLIIGIVVDQMRWDYLYRYAEKYGTGGFKRLQKGYNCENTHIPYVPTYTAPGHTCIYTGSVPAIHGIVGNDWYSRELHRRAYCAEDTTCHTIGAAGNKASSMSPRKLLTTTVTDELRIASNFRSKVIGIAIKDRSAILPAGHAANSAYWFDGKSGAWISSSYYTDTLPAWATNFNALKLPQKYLKENWNRILGTKPYNESTDDDEPYEKPLADGKPTLPLITQTHTETDPEIITNTPWGNTLTFDFAKAAIAGEQLGKRGATDFLALSFSSTDYVGHQFGPNSVEAEDCYIRFDKDLADFLSYLDKTIGEGNYLVFLTADHGAANANGFSKLHQIPTGSVADKDLKTIVNKEIKNQIGIDSMVLDFDNMQLYLKEMPADKHIDMVRLKNVLTTNIGSNNSPIRLALDLHATQLETLPDAILQPITNGYYPKRSGDIQIVYEPAVLEDRALGTTHGTFYNYDTHIPLVWYGWGVKAGHDYTPVYITDIAATIAALLQIQEPNGSVGKPITGLIK